VSNEFLWGIRKTFWNLIVVMVYNLANVLRMIALYDLK
jgi:hypothetical protein